MFDEGGWVQTGGPVVNLSDLAELVLAAPDIPYVWGGQGQGEEGQA